MHYHKDMITHGTGFLELVGGTGVNKLNYINAQFSTYILHKGGQKLAYKTRCHIYAKIEDKRESYMYLTRKPTHYIRFVPILS